MSNDELKAALLSGFPVIFTNTDGREIEYECVSAIVYRKKGKRVSVSAEAQDKCGRSVSYCDPERLRKKEA